MLGDDPLAHFSKRGAGIDGKCGVSEDTGGLECHFGEVDTKIAESTGFFAIEDSDGFFDFKGVASGFAERLIHVGDNGFDLESGGSADTFESLGKLVGFGGGFHERAGSAFDIEGDDFGPASDFFAEDAADDEGEAGHGSGDIAEGVEGFIGGGEAGGLAGEGDTDFFGLGLHLVGRKISVEAGDGGEFVDCATGFSEARAGHFDSGESAGSEDGEEDDGGFVSNSTGAVFVDPGVGESGEVNAVAGFGHGSGEVGSFLIGEAVEKDGHKPSGELVVGDCGLGGTLGDELEFFERVGFLVAFCGDEVEDIHVYFSRAPGLIRTTTTVLSSFSIV